MIVVLVSMALAGPGQSPDADGDGFVTAEELAEGAGGVARAAGLIGLMDVDGDGRWSEAELAAYRTAYADPLAVPVAGYRQQPAFADFAASIVTGLDTSGDGHVGPGEASPDFVRVADRDGDGLVSKAEYANAVVAGAEQEMLPVLAGQVGLVDAGRDGKYGQAELDRAQRLLPADAVAPLAAGDTNGDGTLAGDEVTAWLRVAVRRAQFAHSDVSADGRVDATELHTRLQAPTVEAASALIGFADVDRDGALNFPEFSACRAAIAEGTPTSIASLMFRTHDSDGSGVLDAREWARLAPLLGGMPMAAADLDGNGVVPKELFKALGLPSP